MKGKMTDTELLKGYFIPDIVNDKCGEAYDFIRQDAASAPVKKRGRIKMRTMVISIAAAAALLASVPVAAYFVKSGFNHISHEVYTKNPAEKNDLTPYAKELGAVNQQTHADITMQSVYCDGEALALSFALKPKAEELKNCTCIYTDLYLRLDGELMKSRYTYKDAQTCTGVISFIKADDGMFYGIFNDMNDLKIEKDTKLDIKFAALKGENGKHQKWVPDDANEPYASGTYVPEETGLFNDVFEFSEMIAPDTSLNRLYEVNETQGNVTLKSVLVTPFKTVIDIEGFEEQQTFRIKDQDGEELELISTDEEGHEIAAVPYKTSKKLIIEIYRLNEDNFPTEYSFTVPIERGFADKQNVPYPGNDDTVYEPPMEVIESYQSKRAEKIETAFQKSAANSKKTQMGMPIGIKGYLSDPENERKVPVIADMSVNITGSLTADLSGYADRIDEEMLNCHYDITKDNCKGYKLLLIDYELTNESDKAGRYCFLGYCTYSKDMDFDRNEPDYMENKDNGGKDSYMFDFQPHQTKKITLGYIVPEEDAEKGFYVFVPTDESASGYELTAGNVENGKYAVIDIK